MYPFILSFETINKLKLSIECSIPRPQDAGHLRFRLFLTLKSDPEQESNLKVSTDYLLLQFFYPTIRCIGTVTYKPRRLPRHQRAQALNSTHTVSTSVLCTVYVVNKTVSCVLMNMILVTIL
jgi:hypothetical protein